MDNKTVLISGTGSAGCRHMKNALSLGWDVRTWDPKTHAESFDSFLKTYEGFATKAIIASPPQYHCEQVIACLESGYSTLSEKPLAMDAQEARQVRDCLRDERRNGREDIDCRVAYQMRFLPSLQKHRSDVLVAAASDPFVISHSMFGYDITKWDRGAYPEPYQSRVGVLLEASHELDYLLWTHGDGVDVVGVEVLGRNRESWESAVVVMLRWWNSVIHTMSLDYVSPVYHRHWDFRSASHASSWKYDEIEGRWAYQTELDLFLGEGYADSPLLCTVDEAITLHDLIDQIRSHV